MDDSTVLHEQEEAEEAVSFCDFPVTTDQSDHIRSSSEPSQFFEFFSDLSSEMSHAEDIIFRGKLIPFKQQQQRQRQRQEQQQQQSLSNQTHSTTNREEKLKSSHCRRSESMSELKSSESKSEKTRLMRQSRSLDYQMLNRNLTKNSEIGRHSSGIHRNSSLRSSGRSDNSSPKVLKPRWYVLMFGLLKFPPEMELRDIKNRQVRRNPATMFLVPPLDGEGNIPVNRSSHRKSSWRLLRVLSCKGNASVSVTTSFGCMPEV